MGDNRRPVAEPEVHLLPDGFVGHVTIQHGRADGVPAAREGDARLYRIPAEGMLATQAAPNYGIRPPERMRWFWVGAGDQRTPIPARASAAAGECCVLACYQVGPDFHYFVDRAENADKYKNPAFQESPARG